MDETNLPDWAQALMSMSYGHQESYDEVEAAYPPEDSLFLDELEIETKSVMEEFIGMLESSNNSRENCCLFGCERCSFGGQNLAVSVSHDWTRKKVSFADTVSIIYYKYEDEGAENLVARMLKDTASAKDDAIVANKDGYLVIDNESSGRSVDEVAADGSEEESSPYGFDVNSTEESLLNDSNEKEDVVASHACLIPLTETDAMSAGNTWDVGVEDVFNSSLNRPLSIPNTGEDGSTHPSDSLCLQSVLPNPLTNIGGSNSKLDKKQRAELNCELKHRARVVGMARSDLQILAVDQNFHVAVPLIMNKFFIGTSMTLPVRMSYKWMSFTMSPFVSWKLSLNNVSLKRNFLALHILQKPTLGVSFEISGAVTKPSIQRIKEESRGIRSQVSVSLCSHFGGHKNRFARIEQYADMPCFGKDNIWVYAEENSPVMKGEAQSNVVLDDVALEGQTQKENCGIAMVSSVGGDSWTKEMKDVTTLSYDIRESIAEHASFPAAGPETQCHLPTIRRKLTILDVRVHSLESLIHKLPSKQSISAKELHCRQRMLVNLRSRANQMASTLKMSFLNMRGNSLRTCPIWETVRISFEGLPPVRRIENTKENA